MVYFEQFLRYKICIASIVLENVDMLFRKFPFKCQKIPNEYFDN